MKNYYAAQNSNAGEYYQDIPISDDAHVVENAFYFQNLRRRHAWNSKGTCTIVSLEILLGYEDTFCNDLVVDEHYDVPSLQNTGNVTALSDFTQSPGVDDCDNDDHDFHDYLCKIAKDEIHDDPADGDGMTTLNQIALLDNYLEKRGLASSFTKNTSEGNFGDILTQRAVSVIKDGIDHNRPVISNGSGHSTVAFAYDKDYVWVHTGWGWTGATPWSTYESSIFSNYSAGCIDLIYTANHVHSDNYVSTNNNFFICPCGEIYASTTIRPEDYGFEEQYFSSEKLKSLQSGNLFIETKRLRTGYIQEEYINLSPKRLGAGQAYLEYSFNKSVRKFTINLSYWQILDQLSSSDSSAYFQIKNGRGEWETATDLINDINLTVDRNHQDRLNYCYIGNEIYGFRFIANAPAISPRNLGRISVGSIALIYNCR